MASITIEIPDALLSDAQAVAERANTPIEVIIGQLLEGYVQHLATRLPGNYEILFQYSLGRITEARATAALHLDDAEHLKWLTLQAGLPVPRLSLQESAAMQMHFAEMIDRFGKLGSADTADPEKTK
jgi:hypothetical protein